MRYWMIIILCVFCGCGPKYADTFSGTLEMTEHQLGAKAAGRIAVLSVQEGDIVKAGQLIAVLDRYEQAQKDYQRVLDLFKQGGANQQAVEYAQLAMQDQEVIAPLDGMVLVKVRESGETVGAGGAVVVMGDPKDQWVRIFVPEGMINQIRMNQPAALSFDGLTRTYKGHVRYIATKAEFTPRNVQTAEERVTQAFAVKVALDDTDVQAHPGVAVDVKFDQHE